MAFLKGFWGEACLVLELLMPRRAPDYQEDYQTLFRRYYCGDEDNLDRLLENHGNEINVNEGLHHTAIPITPLVWAIMNHNNKIACLLLKHGADPNIMVGGCKSALTLSAGMNNNLFERMIEYGADIKLALKRDGSTMLRRAANIFNVKRALICIEAGADVNFKNKEGKTPLHSVIREFKNHVALDKRKEMCMLLMDHGADPTIPNNDGQTVLDLIPSYLSELESIMRPPTKCSRKTDK